MHLLLLLYRIVVCCSIWDAAAAIGVVLVAFHPCGVYAAFLVVQEEHAALSAVFEAAVLRLKLEYEEKYRPLYQKRLEALTVAAAEDQSPDKQNTGTPVSASRV